MAKDDEYPYKHKHIPVKHGYATFYGDEEPSQELLEVLNKMSELAYEQCGKIKVDTEKNNALLPCISHWVSFDFMKIETRPKKYGKYLICRKDGKIHWETWNGSGWAYNHNEIRYWAVIISPYA